ncbi:hypothetical protein GC167_02295 [bacterium]|nr:hypothetical protein [bacterium]
MRLPVHTPLEVFSGLSAFSMDQLLEDPYGKQSPVQLRHSIEQETLDRVPLLRVIEEYLKILQRDQYIQLTPLGALPKKVLVELYAKRILLDENVEHGIQKLTKEADWMALNSARLAAQFAGLVRKSHNRLTLTNKALKLLEKGQRSELLRSFLEAYTEKLSWNIHDAYPREPIGQLCWGYTVYTLHLYGDTPRPQSFYAQLYFKAFPHFLTYFQPRWRTVEEQANSCFLVRTFSRFLLLFGCIELEADYIRSSSDSGLVIRTPVLEQLFDFVL